MRMISGKNLSLLFWHSGDFIGGPYVVGNHRQSWSARALGSVKVLHLDQDCLRKLVSQSTNISLALIECLGYKGERYSKLAQVLATHTTTERLALLLLELGKTSGLSSGANIEIGLIQQSRLSYMIGATRQSVSIALQKLEDNNIILRTATSLIILDLTALEQEARIRKS